MPNTARVNLKEVDLTHSATGALLGITGFSGETERGPYADTSILITSWPHFQKVYGGLMNDNYFPLICKRALDRGVQLRINKVGHYTDVTDKSTLDAVQAVLPVDANAQSIQIAIDGAFAEGDTGDITIAGTAETLTIANGAEASIINFANTIKAKYPAVISDVYYGGVDNSGPAGALRYYLIIIPNGVLAVLGNADDDVKATVSRFATVSKTSAGNEYFTVKGKYPGAKYNDVIFKILPASNGDTKFFDLKIGLIGTTQFDEPYPNIQIVGKPTAETSNYLDKVIQNSNLVEITYKDLSAEVDAYLRPANTGYKLSGGTNGGAITDADYIGDSASKVGFHSFDNVEDLMDISAPNKSSSTIHIAGFAYAEGRGDVDYFAHLDNNLANAQSLITERDSSNIDSSYGGFYGGGVVVLDPLSGKQISISEIGDIAGAVGVSDNNFGPWYSFAGRNRGQLPNVLKPVNNFGGSGNFNDLNLLANHQINMVVEKSGKVFLSGNFTAQKDSTSLSFMNVRRLNLYIKKTLKPFLEFYLEEPNDLPTWKTIYQDVKPFLDSLKAKRAVSDFDWQGDQFAKDMNSLKVNVPADVQQGIYKVRLFLTEIVSLQELAVDIVISPAGVALSDVNSQLNA